jgi:hypothetical protein
LRKIAYLLPGAVLSVGLALAGASAAGASTALLHGAGNAGTTVSHHARHTAKPAAAANVKPLAVTPVATEYSQFLAGWINSGTHRFVDIHGMVSDLPNLTSCGPSCDDSVAHGLILASSVNAGGHAYGIAPVWNDTSAEACGTGLWTMEYTPAAFTPTTAQPVPPVSDLIPLNLFNSPVCLSPGTGAEAFNVYESTGHSEMTFNAGPTYADETTLAIDHNVHTSFFAAGVGTTTTSGAIAGLISTGTSFTFDSVGDTVLKNNFPGASQEREDFGDGTIFEMVSTVSGHQNSPTNPIDILPSAPVTGFNFTNTVQ